MPEKVTKINKTLECLFKQTISAIADYYVEHGCHCECANCQSLDEEFEKQEEQWRRLN